MECRNRKGADAGTPTPESCEVVRPANLELNYNRIKKLCLLLHLLSVIGFLVSYYKTSVEFMCLFAGVLITTSIMHVALYPIEED